jgi:hypothetical protein
LELSVIAEEPVAESIRRSLHMKPMKLAALWQRPKEVICKFFGQAFLHPVRERQSIARVVGFCEACWLS